jgi:hypothetical protein
MARWRVGWFAWFSIIAAWALPVKLALSDLWHPWLSWHTALQALAYVNAWLITTTCIEVVARYEERH